MDGLNQNMFSLDVYSYNSQTDSGSRRSRPAGRPPKRGRAACSSTSSPRRAATTGREASAAPGPARRCRATISMMTCARAACRAARRIKRFRDNGGAFGGPIVRDRLWFYTAHRYWGTQKYIQGTYYNKSPNKLLYVPDLDRVAFTNWYYHDNDLRLTWQATAKNKIVRLLLPRRFMQLSGRFERDWRRERDQGDARVASQAPVQPAAERGRQLEHLLPTTNFCSRGRCRSRD